jgi:carboxyl-terminal processing protease
MVVLVNRYSASASEIVAACLQDHSRAIIVGERTWGKGSVQNVIEMEGGKSALKLTTASYKRPNGKNIHRFPDASEADEWGVKPNDGYDAQLTNAEMRELIEGRHDRDIVRRRTTTAIAAAIAGAKPEQLEAKKDEADSKPATESATKDDAEKKPAESPNSDAAKEEAKPADSGAKNNSASSRAYKDRQLQKAVEYLTAELGKGK